CSRRGLALAHAWPDHAHRRERLARRRHAAADDGEIVDAFRQEAAVGDRVPETVVEEAPFGAAVADVQLDGPGGAAHAVVEVPAAEHVVLRQAVAAPDAPRLPQPEAWRGVGQEGAFEARHVPAEKCGATVGLRPNDA